MAGLEVGDGKELPASAALLPTGILAGGTGLRSDCIGCDGPLDGVGWVGRFVDGRTPAGGLP